MADLMEDDSSQPLDNNTLTARLATARRAMSGRNLDAARHQLDAARELARSPTERAELDRALQLCDALEKFWTAIRAEMGRLQPGDQLATGAKSTVVRAARGGELEVEIEGQSHRYIEVELPGPLVDALARRTFDDSREARLLQGAFHAVDRAGDRQRASQLWQEAGPQGGALLPELTPP